MAQLAERLTTPLQIEQHLRLAFEEAYRIRQKPVETEIIDAILAKDINALGPRLTRHGYNAKALAELLDTKPAEIRSFLQGYLTPARAQDIFITIGEGQFFLDTSAGTAARSFKARFDERAEGLGLNKLAQREQGTLQPGVPDPRTR